MRPDPNELFLTEMIQGHFLDRAPDQAQRPRAVVNDVTSTHVDAVMEIATPRRYQVRSQGWFSADCQ
jgi:hypothetical protein